MAMTRRLSTNQIQPTSLRVLFLSTLWLLTLLGQASGRDLGVHMQSVEPKAVQGDAYKPKYPCKNWGNRGERFHGRSGSVWYGFCQQGANPFSVKQAPKYPSSIFIEQIHCAQINLETMYGQDPLPLRKRSSVIKRKYDGNRWFGAEFQPDVKWSRSMTINFGAMGFAGTWRAATPFLTNEQDLKDQFNSTGTIKELEQYQNSMSKVYGIGGWNADLTTASLGFTTHGETVKKTADHQFALDIDVINTGKGVIGHVELWPDDTNVPEKVLQDPTTYSTTPVEDLRRSKSLVIMRELTVTHLTTNSYVHGQLISVNSCTYIPCNQLFPDMKVMQPEECGQYGTIEELKSTLENH